MIVPRVSGVDKVFFFVKENILTPLSMRKKRLVFHQKSLKKSRKDMLVILP